MRDLLRKISLAFAAGCAGGAVTSLAVWYFGKIGLPSYLEVRLAPALTPGWLYPRVVWGGIWGFLFLLPLLKSHPAYRGILYGLGPTIVQLFVIFPRMHQGSMGLGLGVLTPALVFFYNCLWGITATIWLGLTEGRGRWL